MCALRVCTPVPHARSTVCAGLHSRPTPPPWGDISNWGQSWRGGYSWGVDNRCVPEPRVEERLVGTDCAGAGSWSWCE